MNLIQVVESEEITYNGRTLMNYRFHNIREKDSYDNAICMLILRTIKRS
jgi:hypothetical protein